MLLEAVQFQVCTADINLDVSKMYYEVGYFYKDCCCNRCCKARILQSLGKGTRPNIPDSTIQHLYNNYIIINIEKFNCKITMSSDPVEKSREHDFAK